MQIQGLYKNIYRLANRTISRKMFPLVNDMKRLFRNGASSRNLVFQRKIVRRLWGLAERPIIAMSAISKN